MNDAAIRTENLTKSYGKTRALDGLNLHVRPGTVYGFLGRNGAGKTTTIKVLLGLARAQSGTARVLGFDTVQSRESILDRTAFVGEGKALYGWMTGEEFLRFSRSFCARWSQDLAEKYCRLLEVPVNRRIRTWSKGNRTKLCLISALSQGADLLILDEPTEGLDPQSQDIIHRAIVEDHASQGRTVFFSSHHLAQVEQVADWVGIIEAGRIRLEAPLDDIRDRFRVVIASRRDLPSEATGHVLSVTHENGSSRYVLAHEADAFVAGLKERGATVLLVEPLSLRDVFLEFVRKEASCISGD